MFLERLVAVGKIFQKYGLEAADTLKLFADVQEDPRFLANVLVIEVALDNNKFQAAPLPLQSYGEYRTEESPFGGKRKPRTDFFPDVNRGLGLPYVRPTSGNPRTPQGIYGVPVYPVYPKMWEGLDQSAAIGFFQGRLRRTEHLPRDFSEDEVGKLAALLAKTAATMEEKVGRDGNEGYGLVALTIPQDNGPYSYLEKAPLSGDREQVTVGESILYPGCYIVGNLSVLTDYFKASKIAEGAEKGTADRCRLCGQKEAVSTYSKAWSWLAPTWHPPFASRFKRGNKVTDIASAVGALCADCYLALAVGAGVFKEVSGLLPAWLRRELFLPVASAGGREVATGGRVQPIQGTILVLPLESRVTENGKLFKRALNRYRRKLPLRPQSRDRALAAITGIQATLPEELSSDHYRLSMIYFTESNADIHLRAVVEDVLPSVTAKLQEIIELALQYLIPIRRSLDLRADGRVVERYGSLPYLLVRAYGGSYLWTVLADVLHCRPLSRRRFAAGAAARMNGYVKEMLLGSGESARGLAWYSLREEVYYYALFRKFLLEYAEKILGMGGDVMSDWRDLLAMLTEESPEEMTFANPEEVGFAAGYLARRFGRWYYGKLEKDFMRHRVMTFGSDLRPEDIWKRALSRFQEYGAKLDLPISDDFRRRAAVVECEYRHLRPEIEKEKAEFMAAFWSGYALASPTDKNKNREDE